MHIYGVFLMNIQTVKNFGKIEMPAVNRNLHFSYVEDIDKNSFYVSIRSFKNNGDKDPNISPPILIHESQFLILLDIVCYIDNVGKFKD